jgi:hypothetical protein
MATEWISFCYHTGMVSISIWVVYFSKLIEGYGEELHFMQG